MQRRVGAVDLGLGHGPGRPPVRVEQDDQLLGGPGGHAYFGEDWTNGGRVTVTLPRLPRTSTWSSVSLAATSGST